MDRTATTIILLILLIAPAATAGANDDGAVLDGMLANVQLMPGRQHAAITVFPLVLRSEEVAEPLEVSSLRSEVERGRITIAEPTKPARRWNVVLTSRATQPILIPAGTILVGGHLDRMVPKDCILEAGAQIQIPTLPAEYRRDERQGEKAGTDFLVSKHIAPHVLRQGAVFSPRLELVPQFVSRFLDFRAPGDPRHSLASVAASPDLARRVDADVEALASVPRIYEGRVVGWVTVIGGRVHGLDLFGSNGLAADHFSGMIRAHAFSLAAMELRADELRLNRADPMALMDPERFRPQVEAFLDRVKERSWRGQGEGEFRLRRHRSRGLALTRGDRLIHLAAVTDLSFLQRLHDRPLPTPPERTPVPAYGPMERTGVVDGRRNSEYEERLLERMRDRR